MVLQENLLEKFRRHQTLPQDLPRKLPPARRPLQNLLPPTNRRVLLRVEQQEVRPPCRLHHPRLPEHSSVHLAGRPGAPGQHEPVHEPGLEAHKAATAARERELRGEDRAAGQRGQPVLEVVL